MDQTPANSDNTSASSYQQLTELLQVINKHHSELVGTQVYLSRIRNSLGRARDADARQLTEILNQVHRSSVSVQLFYQSLENLPGRLSSSMPHRYELLVALHKVDKQLSEDLVPALTLFHGHSRTSATQQIMYQRQIVLNQLDKVIDNLRNANSVINKIPSPALMPQDNTTDLHNTPTSQDGTQPSQDQQQMGPDLEQTGGTRTGFSNNTSSASQDSTGSPVTPDSLQLFPNSVDLRHAMINALDQQEFELLCGDLGLRYEDLKGDTLELKMQSLILHFSRQKKYPQLVQRVLHSYPHIADWRQSQ